MEDDLPFYSKRKTDRKPTYTHKTSVDNRRKMLDTFVDLGIDLKEVEHFGTIEQIIWGEEVYRSGLVELQYIPNIPKDPIRAPRAIPIHAIVKSRKKDKQDYSISAEIVKTDIIVEGKMHYRLDDTVDINHSCDFTTHEKMKKWLKRPCCAHVIAYACMVHDKISKLLRMGNIHYIEISSYYKSHDLIPLDRDIHEFYSTIRHMKAADRNNQLYEYFMADSKMFRNNDWD